MVKNFLLTIFISILTIGCDNQITGPIDWEEEYGESEASCETDYGLVLLANLPPDENGYRVMEYNGNETDGYSIQTFATLRGYTMSKDVIQAVNWYTDSGMWVGISEYPDSLMWWQFATEGSSYTDEDGIAYTVLSAWESFIGDTVKVWADYYDECGNYYGTAPGDTLRIRVIDEY